MELERRGRNAEKKRAQKAKAQKQRAYEEVRSRLIETCIETKRMRIIRRVRSVGLIPEEECEGLRGKITFARILMLLEYKGDLQYRFPTKCCLEIVLYFAPNKKARGYYVYSHSRIGSIERALRCLIGPGSVLSLSSP